MSHAIWFFDEHRYAPADHGVKLTVTLFAKGGPQFDVQALLDSGAAISVFDRAYASAIGIDDIPSGRPVPVQAANEEHQTATGYVHDIVIEVLGRTLLIPAVFVPDWPEGTPNLLGMEGFFTRWAFGFQHTQGRLSFTPTI